MKYIFTVCICMLLAFQTEIAVFPFYSFAKSSTADKINIVIDPGHGGKDGGAASASHAEKYYNWKVAEYCINALLKDGRFNVGRTRSGDYSTSNLERAEWADSMNADAMICIHFNSSLEKSIKGTEIMVSNVPKFMLYDLAKVTKNHLVNDVGLEMRSQGIFTRPDTGDEEHLYYWSYEYNWDIPDDESLGLLSDYYEITTLGCKLGIPVMIIEYGYISNADDLAFADNESNLKKMGEATAAALIEYYTGHTHRYSDDKTVDYPTSCLYAGKESYHCEICGHRNDVTALADSPDSDAHCWLEESRTESTCTTHGSVTYYCRYHQSYVNKKYRDKSESAEHTKTEELPLKFHSYSRIEFSDDNSYITAYCSKCGKNYTFLNTKMIFDDAVSDAKKAIDNTLDGISEKQSEQSSENFLGYSYEEFAGILKKFSAIVNDIYEIGTVLGAIC